MDARSISPAESTKHNLEALVQSAVQDLTAAAECLSKRGPLKSHLGRLQKIRITITDLATSLRILDEQAHLGTPVVRAKRAHAYIRLEKLRSAASLLAQSLARDDQRQAAGGTTDQHITHVVRTELNTMQDQVEALNRILHTKRGATMDTLRDQRSIPSAMRGAVDRTRTQMRPRAKSSVREMRGRAPARQRPRSPTPLQRVFSNHVFSEEPAETQSSADQRPVSSPPARSLTDHIGLRIGSVTVEGHGRAVNGNVISKDFDTSQIPQAQRREDILSVLIKDRAKAINGDVLGQVDFGDNKEQPAGSTAEPHNDSITANAAAVAAVAAAVHPNNFPGQYESARDQIIGGMFKADTINISPGLSAAEVLDILTARFQGASLDDLKQVILQMPSTLPQSSSGSVTGSASNLSSPTGRDNEH